MLHLIEDPNADHVKEIAHYFQGTFNKDTNASTAKIKNDSAVGTISSFHIFPGLSVWVYDITFSSDFPVTLAPSADRPFYFSYNLKGNFLHKFSKQKKYLDIDECQYMMVIGDPVAGVEIIFPANTKLEICVIIIRPELLGATQNMNALSLQTGLNEVFKINADLNPYRLVERIDPEIFRLAESILRNDRTDLIGCLSAEGAVMNLLSLQIGYHKKLSSLHNKTNKLSSSELEKLSTLGDYVLANLNEKISLLRLSSHYGISPNKIQEGSKMLYGLTASKYIMNIKLGYAKDLMRKTDLNVSEVCYEIGIASLSYFSKIYHERFGILPSEYKSNFEERNPIFELCYSSLMLDKGDSSDLKDIVRFAREFNFQNDITGCLAHSNGTIVQILEGKKNTVLELFERIKLDTRHHKVDILWSGPLLKRHFENWSMALISDESDLSKNVEQRISKSGHIDFLKNLKRSATVFETMFTQFQKLMTDKLSIDVNKQAG